MKGTYEKNGLAKWRVRFSSLFSFCRKKGLQSSACFLAAVSEKYHCARSNYMVPQLRLSASKHREGTSNWNFLTRKSISRKLAPTLISYSVILFQHFSLLLTMDIIFKKSRIKSELRRNQVESNQNRSRIEVDIEFRLSLNRKSIKSKSGFQMNPIK